jgi:putative membrane protein
MGFLSRKRPGAAMLAGAVGGLIGAWFKLGWEVPWPPRAPGRTPEPMLLISAFTHVATPMWQSLVVHFSFSILSGIAYGALVEFFPVVALGTGVAFGVAVWIGAHEIVMPLVRLTPPTWQLPANEQGSEFFGHAIWGWVIGVFYAVYRPRFGGRERVADSGETTSGPLPVAESVAVYKRSHGRDVARVRATTHLKGERP